ncbi:MAG: mechanosensitive ion channel [Clostridiales bacterium]|nr:mechanosensitive ion channel [Clostridiales bacterium]
MNEWIIRQALQNGLSQTTANYAVFFLTVIVIALTAAVAYKLSKLIVLKLLVRLVSKSKAKWDDAFAEHKVFHQAIILVPAAVIHIMSPMLVTGAVWVSRFAAGMMVFGILLTADRLLRVADALYRRTEASKTRPIKGFLQVIRIVLYAVGGIVIISVFFNRSPALLLGGIGAASAVLLLVFQNTILGFVASIQLTENDMIRIGDWIEMPSHNADGDVKEITLYTVKVENWDKTITTVPTYSMITDSFKNWRGMTEAGGRRIKRSVQIDIGSVKFCTAEMLERFSKIQYIKEYLERKTDEIKVYNQAHSVDSSSDANGRRLTNVGTFRAYLEAYLANNPRIHHGMTMLVRQMQPGEAGIPIEIYAFTSTTSWNEYEAIQADIFDHVLAVVPEFDLRIYQKPTGSDLKGLMQQSEKG